MKKLRTAGSSFVGFQRIACYHYRCEKRTLRTISRDLPFRLENSAIGREGLLSIRLVAHPSAHTDFFLFRLGTRQRRRLSSCAFEEHQTMEMDDGGVVASKKDLTCNSS
ncbi:hypothetical protein GALMADRAFT_259304 [Galerina marginata CBS 339.88]|uniref:Uncharacterized protein n=1 Tax=Galerina marginata (strain CBS 339.88) TaxID=685588 RepID=A0A067SFJ8_GALM3|nr:hypothetical protein GALMADRAFT_259304 [Galerina marginata CBS 339.88]